MGDVLDQESGLLLEIGDFHGPFDLLLHLIRKMKIDINDIPMAEITDQYLTYVKTMQEIELDQVADYLVMAATLIEIKSRLLLPVEAQSEDEEGDPREELVQQLLLYQQFQTVAYDLQEMEEKRAKHYSRPQVNLAKYQSFIPLKEGAVTVSDLAGAFKTALEDQLARKPRETKIEADPVSVSEKIDDMKIVFEKLDEKDTVTFDDFILSGTRSEIVTTFMAMLEMVRKHMIEFKQEERAGQIEMRRKKGSLAYESN